MTPLFHPSLVNGPVGDPALYIEFLFEKRAILFDLGELGELPPKKILRLSHVFVSHTHMDHFGGFDRLLRIILGREKHLHLFGPEGFIDRVTHKLGAYSWNLVANYDTNLTLTVTEVHSLQKILTTDFQLKEAFKRNDTVTDEIEDGILLEEAGFRIRTQVLDHLIPSLGFALEESRHINVLKSGVEKMGFRVGPWLSNLRHAVLNEAPDDMSFEVQWKEDGKLHRQEVALGELKANIFDIVPGQKIAYVSDVAFNDGNMEKISDLARDADIFFIEASFLAVDENLAASKAHLTARQAGMLARQAGAKNIEPFHFSARYTGRESEVVEEALTAFSPN